MTGNERHTREKRGRNKDLRQREGESREWLNERAKERREREKGFLALPKWERCRMQRNNSRDLWKNCSKRKGREGRREKITLNNGEWDHLRCGRYLKNRGLVRGQPRPRPPRVRLRLTGDATRLRPAPRQDGREIFGGGADLSTYFPQCKVAPEKLNFPMSYLGRQTLCWFVAAA